MTELDYSLLKAYSNSRKVRVWDVYLADPKICQHAQHVAAVVAVAKKDTSVQAF